MNERQSRLFRNGKTATRLGLLAGIAAMLACSTYRQRIPPIPLPSGAASVEVQGTRLAAVAYVDPEQAEQAFGFNIRGAGLLPVRLVIDNQGRNVVKVNPQQTFLVDRQGLAWPLLTADQAQNRVVDAVAPGETLKSAAGSALWGGTAGAATGFAIGVILQGGFTAATHGPLLEQATMGGGIGALLGGGRDTYALENRIRQDLNGKSLRNQRLQPGELAQGYLFFPGQEEAQSADFLRLGLELDGYPQAVIVRFAPARIAR